MPIDLLIEGSTNRYGNVLNIRHRELTIPPCVDQAVQELERNLLTAKKNLNSSCSHILATYSALNRESSFEIVIVPAIESEKKQIILAFE
ncbi:hypothetical protein CSW00_28580 [Pseudomonas asiatica]|nr:hypothetical protein CSW00_28580 [Pseudomonas sp. MR 02]